MGILEIFLFSQVLEISGAKKINKMLAVIPKVVAKVLQFFTDLNPFSKFFLANSSETMYVQARLIPDVANVMAKLYIDITRLKIPIVS